MDFDKIKAMSERDTQMDGTELDIESINKNKLFRLKWEYYNGKMDKDALDELGWEPFQLNILKKDIDIYLNSDKELSMIHDRISYQEVKLEFLEEILKELNNRHWKIRNAIEWRKFTSGGF